MTTHATQRKTQYATEDVDKSSYKIIYTSLCKKNPVHGRSCKRARSYLSGQGSNSAKCEVAIPFNRFQRPAL
jgi:hypothetical protein